MSEIKPCPFCGRKPEILQDSDGDWGLYHAYLGEDDLCPISGGSPIGDWFYETEEEAIEAWNRREGEE